MRRVALALILVALIGCQGHDDTAKPAPPEKVAPADAPAVAMPSADVDGGDEPLDGGAGTGSGSDVPEIANGGDSADDAEALAKSAASVWQAVVDRDRYLARRGQSGVIEGRVGAAVVEAAPAPAPPAPAIALDAGAPIDAATGPALTWLVDDREADGSLAIHVDFSAVAAPKEGARVAVTGAWALDESRRWYWKASAVVALAAGPAPDPATQAPPGHVVIAAPPPGDARAATRLADGNGALLFQILAPPRQDGDGWTIANQLGDLPVARLLLPGERPSYGGHDLRTPDERWQLKRAVTYWVRIGKVRKPPAPAAGAHPTEPALPIVHALGAPRRVP